MAEDVTYLAEELWTREIPINSSRGMIYDRNGKLIVGNELALSLASINRQIDDPESTAIKLARILDCDTSAILNHLTKNVSIELIKPEGRKISKSEVLKILAEDLDGIYIVSDSNRYYPYGTTLAQTVGFCGIDGEGLAGLEYKYNDYLESTDGSLQIYTDAKGHLMQDMTSLYESATPGMDLYLTIDLELQLIMDNIINNAIAKYDPDQVMGLMVSAKTGEVLAMTSYPYFDPANYQDYSAEVYNRILPIFYSFEPGSTFKFMTYSAGLEENLFTLNDPFYCCGYKIVEDRKIRCWKSGGHGSETYLTALENSCNPLFMTIAEKLGVERFYSYLEDYGFGKKTGIDLSGESTGILVDKSIAGPVELATMGFGQSNAVTPIQLVMASIACVTGDLLTPYILREVRTNSDEQIYENTKKVKRTVISDDTVSLMRYALESVVACGTGRNAFVEGARIGGKTGTAQKISDTGGYLANNYILSFLGIAPMNDPEIVCYIALDNPKNCIQYGGVIAAPIVGDVLEQSLTYLGIDRDYENQIEKKLRWGLDTTSYEVPNYIGLTKREIKQNGYYNIVYLGNGSKVISQSPSFGERINEGDTIMLYLG